MALHWVSLKVLDHINKPFSTNEANISNDWRKALMVLPLLQSFSRHGAQNVSQMFNELFVKRQETSCPFWFSSCSTERSKACFGERLPPSRCSKYL